MYVYVSGCVSHINMKNLFYMEHIKYAEGNVGEDK